jgi:ribosomal protein S14
MQDSQQTNNYLEHKNTANEAAPTSASMEPTRKAAIRKPGRHQHTCNITGFEFGSVVAIAVGLCVRCVR